MTNKEQEITESERVNATYSMAKETGRQEGIQHQKAKQDKFIEKLKYVLRNNYTIPDEKPRFKARKELIEMIIKDLDKLTKEVLEK